MANNNIWDKLTYKRGSKKVAEANFWKIPEDIKDQVILIYDNEPRNKEIIKKIEEEIKKKSGEIDLNLDEKKIEYENLHHLRWGTADAKGLTVSFWFKSTQGGSHGCCLFMNNGASVLPRTFSVSANTWTKITLAIAANTSLQFTADFGLSFGFLLNVGTTADNGTENTWGSFPAANSGIANIGGGSGRIIQFTGVQLEVGSATPYEHRTYGDEQKKCERYCQKYKTYTSTGFWNGGTNARTYFTLRTKMRATPSFAEQNGSGNKGTITWSGAYKTSTGSASIAAYDNDTVYFSRSGFSGGSDMVGLIHLHQNWENIFSAEL